MENPSIEDLNGYGYDDVDAYTRYGQVGSAFLQFFDASCIRHIGFIIQQK